MKPRSNAVIPQTKPKAREKKLKEKFTGNYRNYQRIYHITKYFTLKDFPEQGLGRDKVEKGISWICRVSKNIKYSSKVTKLALRNAG